MISKVYKEIHEEIEFFRDGDFSPVHTKNTIFMFGGNNQFTIYLSDAAHSLDEKKGDMGFRKIVFNYDNAIKYYLNCKTQEWVEEQKLEAVSMFPKEKNRTENTDIYVERSYIDLAALCDFILDN